MNSLMSSCLELLVTCLQALIKLSRSFRDVCLYIFVYGFLRSSVVNVQAYFCHKEKKMHKI